MPNQVKKPAADVITYIVAVAHECEGGTTHRYEDGPFATEDEAKAVQRRHGAMGRIARVSASNKPVKPPKPRTKKLDSLRMFGDDWYGKKATKGLHGK